MSSQVYLGLMSGTSLDGIDAVAADFDTGVRVLAHVHRPFEPALRAELLALNRTGADELHRAALASNALALAYAGAVADLLAAGGLESRAVQAIGAHGQTVRHRPGEFDGRGYTLQVNNPALLAERTGIDVVADLRSRDVAAGGQGAPLVPAFHQAMFRQSDRAVAVLNLGGISNLTLMRPGEAALGFDCGPANVLMDLWAQRHLGTACDHDGAWAATGQVDAALLAMLLSEPYFALPAPKSTGRDLFDADWLDRHLAAVTAAPRDVQATLAALTVRCVVNDLARHGRWHELLVCGGGAENGHLMRSLALALPATQVATTVLRGLPPSQVEATAFAWLARECIARRPGNLPSVTGARGPRVLGAVYPA